ncbi:hypothetical protein BKA66DRAFT_566564 [Pyrenochaeta sp. MPI-SDFR-AT-0127]|nr:hypothetical protein BKA66DRAFT_566564 [Pyrenochaeta sp. MPI-SDFR-AT-0127]
MARLSEEHYKSNPSTPIRKSSRFKEMFKRRPSPLSSSTSPNSLTKLPIMESPIPSPKIDPGFEQVGLLPSERISLDEAKHLLEKNGGKAIKKAIEEDMKGIEMKNVPHKFDNSSNVSDAKETGNVTEMAAQHSQRQGNSAAQDRHHCDLSALQVLNINDAYSRAIREFVAGEIHEARAKNEQHSVEHAIANATPGVHITVNFRLLTFSKFDANGTIERKNEKLDLLGSPTSLGPFLINHARLATDLQLTVVAIYLTILLYSAFSGPKTILLTLWRMGVALSVYGLILRQLGMKNWVHCDLLLSPVLYTGHKLLDSSGITVKMQT